MRLGYTSGVCAVDYMSVFSVVVLTFPTTKPCQGIGYFNTWQIVHINTPSIFRPFVEPIALESRTPPLGYSQRRPRGPY